jgi:hypothetical protein
MRSLTHWSDDPSSRLEAAARYCGRPVTTTGNSPSFTMTSRHSRKNLSGASLRGSLVQGATTAYEGQRISDREARSS